LLRHAKASTAGSTQRQAAGLGRSFGGALGAAFLAALCALALAASPALAARGHQFKESFGAPCTVEPCAPGSLEEPTAVAVNETTGEVYVLDQANDRIEIFNVNGETGAFVSQFDGSETPAGSLQYPSGAANPANIQVSAIAVDNSCALEGLSGTACEEADLSNEAVYVLDAGHEVIDKFSPTGVYLGQITEYENVAAESKPFHEPSGVAVATDGFVWVRQLGETFNRGVLEHYANDLGNAFEGQRELSNVSSGGFLSPGFAVDGEGAFYRRNQHGPESFEAEKLTPSGQTAIENIGEVNASGIAVDQRLNNSFIDGSTFVAAFSPTGSELEVLGEEEGAHHLTRGAGLAVDSAAENIYVADAAAGEIVVFEAQQPKTPEIVSEGASAISSGSATLLAELNPRSNSEKPPTTYHFQYGPCSGGLVSCASSPFPFSTPDEVLPADFEIHSVSTLVSGLEPHTAYHYRLSAENSLSTEPTLGEELTFTTQGSASASASALLDRRAYELVSPPDKRGANIEAIAETGIVQAAPSGAAITYLANAATEPQPQGVGKGDINVLSAPSPAGGWASQDLGIPHDTPTGPGVGSGAES
jgi:hypothetical protein